MATTAKTAVSPDLKATFDLAASRAARQAALGEQPTVRAEDGNVYRFKPECPLIVLELADAGRISDALAAMLADPGDAAAFLAAERDLMTKDDLEGLLKALYGLGPTA